MSFVVFFQILKYIFFCLFSERRIYSVSSDSSDWPKSQKRNTENHDENIMRTTHTDAKNNNNTIIHRKL